MGLQTAQCCCCTCSVTTLCCACVCKRLCVVVTPPEGSVDDRGQACKPRSVELEWDVDEQHWAGPLDEIDLLYYFEQEYGLCFLKLRSTFLGYPLGSERTWIVGNGYGDVSCKLMETTIENVPEIGTGSPPTHVCTGGTLTTYCAHKINPAVCTGCQCACECLCVTYIKGDDVVGIKACWDGINSWTGTIHIGSESISIVLSLFPKSDLQEFIDRSDYDPNDHSCRLVLSYDYGDQLSSDPHCPDVEGIWTILGGPSDDDTTIIVRCAVCADDCAFKEIGCCPKSIVLPETLFATMEITLRVVDQTQPININPFPPIIFEGDCATFVFALNKVTYGAVDPFHWLSDFTLVPGCGCENDTTGGQFQLDLICSSLAAYQSVLAGCAFEPPFQWTDFARIYSCNPYYAVLNIPLPVYGSTNQDYYGISKTGLLQTWCCGVDFLASHPGHPASWVFVTGVKITITE